MYYFFKLCNDIIFLQSVNNLKFHVFYQYKNLIEKCFSYFLPIVLRLSSAKHYF